MDLRKILLAIEFVSAILLIVVILLQPSKQEGLKGFIGGAQDTFFSRNQGRTRETFLARLTVFLAVVIAVISIALSIIK